MKRPSTPLVVLLVGAVAILIYTIWTQNITFVAAFVAAFVGAAIGVAAAHLVFRMLRPPK